MFPHEPSPINTRHQPDPFFDDSILFSQNSNFGTQYDFPHQLQSPITAQNNITVRDHDRDFSQLLTSNQNYLNNNANEEDSSAKEKLKGMINYANYTLHNYGFSKLGDLESNKEEEIQKSVNAVLEVIQQRQRDLDYRKEVFDIIAKLESDKKMLVDRNERYKNESKQLSKEIGGLRNLQLMAEKKFKGEKEKLTLEKDELAKQMSKLLQKQTQYQHEIRKKEVEVNKIKEQMRKVILEKNNSKTPENRLSDSDGYFRSRSNNNAYENDFTNMISITVDQYRTKLLNENQDLRGCLRILFEELNSLIALKKDEFIKKKLKESPSKEEESTIRLFYEKHFSESEMTYLRTGATNLPFEKAASEIQALFKTNLKALGSYFDKMASFSLSSGFVKDIAKNFSEIDHEFAEIRNVIDLKKAVESYKVKINNKGDDSTLGLNKENRISISNHLQRLTISSPQNKKLHEDTKDFYLKDEDFFKTPKSECNFGIDDNSFLIPENKPEASSSNYQQVKRAKAEVNKWKMALHSKPESLFTGFDNHNNIVLNNDGTYPSP